MSNSSEANPAGSSPYTRDPELYQDLREQVLELAQIFASPENRAAYERMLEQQEAERARQHKEQEKSRGATGPGAFEGIITDIIAGGLAYLTWGILILVLGGGILGAVAVLFAFRRAPAALAPETVLASSAPGAGSENALPKTSGKVTPAHPSSPHKPPLSGTSTPKSLRASTKSGVPRPSAKHPSAASTPNDNDPENAPESAMQGSSSSPAALSSAPKPAASSSTSTKPSSARESADSPWPPSPSNSTQPSPAPSSSALGKKPPATQKRPSPPPRRKPENMAALPPNLKKLWIEGANAKHRGDFEGARRAWSKALRVAPGHYGFQESINKLPKKRTPKT